MAKVFVSRRIFKDKVEKLKEAGHKVEMNDTSTILSNKELQNKVSDKQALICLLNDDITPQLMDAGPDLDIIANVAVGYDNIDVEAATERGIMITNTPGVLTETTADLALALLLSAARRIPEADRYSRAGKYDGWELMQPHLGVDVYGKTLGIAGMGRIGSAVAERAHYGFDMNVIYYDQQRNKKIEDELNAQSVEFNSLLKRSDFISVHLPLTEKTRGLFSTEQFREMKEEAILINAARGPIVDEDALAESLKRGEILGAGLDVFEKEPEVHPELAKLDEHVVLTPHIGSASRETREKMADMAVTNVIRGLNGEKPPNLINEELY